MNQLCSLVLLSHKYYPLQCLLVPSHMISLVQKLVFSSTLTLQEKVQKQIHINNNLMNRESHPMKKQCFVPRVCCMPWTMGTYLADKEGVLCRETSGISCKDIKTGAWSDPSSLTLCPPFHLWALSKSGIQLKPTFLTSRKTCSIEPFDTVVVKNHASSEKKKTISESRHTVFANFMCNVKWCNPKHRACYSITEYLKFTLKK